MRIRIGLLPSRPRIQYPSTKLKPYLQTQLLQQLAPLQIK